MSACKIIITVELNPTAERLLGGDEAARFEMCRLAQEAFAPIRAGVMAGAIQKMNADVHYRVEDAL